MTDKKDISIHEALLLSYLHGKTSPEEERAIQQWLAADVQNERRLEQLARLCFVQRASKRIASRDATAAYEKVCRHIERKKRREMIRRVASVAASVAVLILVAFGTYFFTRSEVAEPHDVTVYANAGMRTQLDLPDGTHVILNAGSSLTYALPFVAKQRNVILDGEGFFRVAHDSRHPFVVGFRHDELQIEVLGTEFNVMAYAEDESIRTTLVNGRVNLNLCSGVCETRMLVPSECAVYDRKSKHLQVNKVNTLYDTAWKDGILMFRDTPLPEVLNRLSRFYNVLFEVRDKIIESYVFTGTFENRQLSQILDYLRITSQIKYNMVYPKEDDGDGIKRTKVILMK